ncbi:helix-turn-helix domain-containing protein [Telmatocola sphagniphila]|uniref:Helix-turn-helix domain-containing protein n=1 Tax=Telmatocola sphagniphila TaxID=1123043 RepID=A0A8E6B3Q3_9BACT|nr:helix-turn-helix transcriptional regulator [Telmatocola sphagniphila]QVL30744.1 helix-turn-helix domain-containing protein [Telmatocola sphagniphila]
MNIKVKPAKRTMILLDRRPKRAAAFAGLHPEVVSSVSGLLDSVTHSSKDSIWVSYESNLTEALIKRASPTPASLGLGLFLHEIDLKTIPVLSSLFRRIAFAVDGKFLPAEELAEVLEADNRENLLIGGFVNEAQQTITLWRGNLLSLTVPFSAFENSGDGTKPDFKALSVIDCGQTVKLGNYEAAVDSLLYEYDPLYRREISKKRLQEDRSFGASLRRLRKQRGLRREDFEPDVAAKTVARIEQGKVTRIQKTTLVSLAKHLSVKPDEIASY